VRVEAFTTADGRKLSYLHRGRGRVLVCLPGGPGYSSLYFGDLAGLAEHCTLIMVNPRGTGGSDHPLDHHSYSIADYAADLEELRAHLQLERVDLLGHSHGGMVAIHYAALYPRRVDHLVLSNTVVRSSDEQRRWEEEILQTKGGEPWYEDARAAANTDASDCDSVEELARVLVRELPLHFAHYGDAERSYAEMLAGEERKRAFILLNRESLRSFDFRPELARIEAKALVLSGDRDANSGPPSALETAEHVVGAKVVVLADCGHFPFVEAPERFRSEVIAFLGT
jgi:proline-specific peptidase